MGGLHALHSQQERMHVLEPGCTKDLGHPEPEKAEQEVSSGGIGVPRPHTICVGPSSPMPIWPITVPCGPLHMSLESPHPKRTVGSGTW